MTSKVHIESFWRSLNKKNEELCGDKVVMRFNDESFIMVLADGLGSGVKANILSTLTSTIISEMVSTGASLQDVIETIAGTLPVCKERGVAYSTFTIVRVHFNGYTHIVEFDNPSAIIIRDGKILDVEHTTQVINGKTITECNFEMVPDDYVVAFSDGIIHAGVGQVLNFGWDHKDVEKFLVEKTNAKDSAKEIARILLANVNYLYNGEPGDDSTVACVKAIQATETRVMVGPPEHQEDDEKVVKKLMDATGLKICCGGTTSNIVSRILKQPIKTDDLINMLSDVPPKGYIEGIDLVTEGVLTLQKVNGYLRKCVQDYGVVEQLMNSKEQDGASCLVRRFLNDCTEITFMVGLSDNPAHDAIAYSTISLNAKIQLINEMAENLRKLGKIVHIEMY